MVECKYVKTYETKEVELRFNRYMVECKFNIFDSRTSRSIVLIDTWWNVNLVYDESLSYYEVVLIDTWWNVNQGTLENVENNTYVLIDTWWNVNDVQAAKRRYKKIVLIDTWWNVNRSLSRSF